VAAAGLSTVLSLFIAFPLARRLVRVSEGIYRSVLIGFFLPIAIIPLFIEARALDLYNNRLGYIVLHVEPGIPLGVIVLTAVIRTLPLELDEAAQMDGCPYWRYLWEVVTPVAAPGMVVTFLYAFLGVWNDIIGPTVFLNQSNLFPVSRGLFAFEGQHLSEWTLLMAAIVLVSLPVLVLFIAMQRRLIRASIGGALK
jgi:raffinose/stachyose/melibiose transport system permease protein